MIKTERLIQNIIEQIKEAQLKLGFEKEIIRLYFPVDSMNTLLQTDFQTEEALLQALREADSFRRTRLGELKFFCRKGRIEVRIAPEGAEYVAREVPDPPFLKALITLFATHHHLSIEAICDCFQPFGAYHCEKMPSGTDFDYVIYFADDGVDAYYYCIKMEMGHTIYHRFTREDYQIILRETEI